MRSTRSKDDVSNKHKLKSLGLKGFSANVLRLWNNLLDGVKPLFY